MLVSGLWIVQQFVLTLGASVSSGSDDCLQPSLLYGVEDYRDKYEYVCCNNQHWAEPFGFHAAVGFFPGLEASGASSGVTTFYDPQCGIPLFQAPKGRSYAEWKHESEHHGWPSFREEEIIFENLREVAGGEIVSTCGTHLGHNLPSGAPGPRYCINLICMAGLQTDTPNNTGAPSPSQSVGVGDSTVTGAPSPMPSVSSVAGEGDDNSSGAGSGRDASGNRSDPVSSGSSSGGSGRGAFGGDSTSVPSNSTPAIRDSTQASNGMRNAPIVMTTFIATLSVMLSLCPRR
jgi:peptide methionine sulfoxide reductase MsrB